MNWTTLLPGVPGFYWHRTPTRAPTVCEVVAPPWSRRGELYVSFLTEHDWLELRDGPRSDLPAHSEWCGPIAPPPS